MGGPRVGPAHTTAAAPEGCAEARVGVAGVVPGAGGPGGRGVARGPAGSPARASGGVVTVVAHLTTSPSYSAKTETKTDNNRCHVWLGQTIEET